MRHTHVLLLCTLTIVAAAAFGQSANPPAPPSGAGPHLREDIRQNYFAERKERVLHQLSERISIATAAQACVRAASAGDQLRACLQQEHAAAAEVRSER
jgi:hypothetical protein